MFNVHCKTKMIANNKIWLIKLIWLKTNKRYKTMFAVKNQTRYREGSCA